MSPKLPPEVCHYLCSSTKHLLWSYPKNTQTSLFQILSNVWLRIITCAVSQHNFLKHLFSITGVPACAHWRLSRPMYVCCSYCVGFISLSTAVTGHGRFPFTPFVTQQSYSSPQSSFVIMQHLRLPISSSVFWFLHDAVSDADYLASKVTTIDKWCMWKELEGSGDSVMEAIPRNVCGRMRKTTETLRKQVSVPRFEPNFSQHIHLL